MAAETGSRGTISLPEPAIKSDAEQFAAPRYPDSRPFEGRTAGNCCRLVLPQIGSESSPIIQFYDSLGFHDIAERAIQFFLNRQREDGFIQSFAGYQLETGPLLWTMGTFRYTKTRMARRIQMKVLKACNFLVAWRRRNLREKLSGRGYGLLEGKVADPQDFYHSYMLNGLTYFGLKRAVEMHTLSMRLLLLLK